MAYITVGSTFTPLTYEERIKPYQDYITKAEKLEEQYNTELMSLTQLDALLPEGSQLKAQSQQLIDKLNESVDLLHIQGWDRETKKELNDLRRSSQAFIAPATNAITKYEKYIDERIALENQYGKENILFRDSYTIDDFVNKESGKEISYHPSYINLYNLDKSIINDVIATVSNAGHTKIGSRKQGNSTIGRYYSGYSLEDVRNMKGDLKTIYDNARQQIIDTYSPSDEELQIIESRIMEAIAVGASQTYKEYEQIDSTTTRTNNGGYDISYLRDLEWLQKHVKRNEKGEILVDESGWPIFIDNSNDNTYTSGIGFTVSESEFEDANIESEFENINNFKTINILDNTFSDADLANMTSINKITDKEYRDRAKFFAEKIIEIQGLPGSVTNYNIYIKEEGKGVFRKWGNNDTMKIYLQPKSKHKINTSNLNNENSDTSNLS